VILSALECCVGAQRIDLAGRALDSAVRLQVVPDDATAARVLGPLWAELVLPFDASRSAERPVSRELLAACSADAAVAEAAIPDARVAAAADDDAAATSRVPPMAGAMQPMEVAVRQWCRDGRLHPGALDAIVDAARRCVDAAAAAAMAEGATGAGAGAGASSGGGGLAAEASHAWHKQESLGRASSPAMRREVAHRTCATMP
jgi:hypothetical protein